VQQLKSQQVGWVPSWVCADATIPIPKQSQSTNSYVAEDISHGDAVSTSKPSAQVEWSATEGMALSRLWCLWEIAVGTGFTPHKEIVLDSYKELVRCVDSCSMPGQLIKTKGKPKRFTSKVPGNELTELHSIVFSCEGIEPTYEDPANQMGGHWQISLKPKYVEPEEADEIWRNIALGAMLGNLQPAGVITSVRLVDKMSEKMRVVDHIRIEVWYSSTSSPEEIVKLKSSVTDCLTEQALRPKDALLQRQHSKPAL